MDSQRKITRMECALLALTALFLSLLLTLCFRDRASVSIPAGTEVEFTIPQEAIQPEVKLVNLNIASAEELETLPGIGGKLAERIIAYRTENGPFETVEDLANVSGIGEAKLADLEGYVTVEEPEK